MWVRLPLRPLMRFLYMYVARAGFLDGRAGFTYCVFKAIQEFHISCKMYEARKSAHNLAHYGNQRKPLESAEATAVKAGSATERQR
jgi:hypothetical protein